MDKMADVAGRGVGSRFADAAGDRVPGELGGDRIGLPEFSARDLRLRRSLFDYFWRRLAFARVVEETGARDHDQLARAASASLVKIEGWREDVRRFGETVCECSIEHRSEGVEIPSVTERAVQGRLEALVSRVESLRDLPPLLTAKLMAKPLGEVCDELEDSLRRFCDGVIDDLFRVLDSLVDAKIAGAVERIGSNCELHFFRHVMIQETVGSTTSTKSHSTASSLIEEQSVTKTSRVEYRLGDHEHHVMNVVETAIDDSEIDVPQRYLPLVEDVPRWLRPHLCLLKGDLIRERIVEIDLDTDFLETTVVTRTERRYSPTISFDPAIVFGDYVLGGWGSREIRHQAVLRESERVELRKQRCRRDSIVYGVASVVLVLFGTGLLLASSVNPSMLVAPAVLSSLLGMAAAYFGLEQYTQARRPGSVGGWFPFAATTAVGLLTAAVQFGIGGLVYSLYWLLLAIPLMFLGFAVSSLAEWLHPEA